MSTTVSEGARARAVARHGSLERQRRWIIWGSYAALSAFVLMFLIPPFYMVMTSLKSSAEISAEKGNPWIVRDPTLSNFGDLITSSSFQRYFFNSAWVTTLVVIISMTIAILAAFSLARMGFRGSQAIATSVFLTYLVPPSLLFIPLFQFVGWLDLIDTTWFWCCCSRRWRCRSAPGS